MNAREYPGSKPSRAMAIKMRGCPNWKTSNTEVIPASAPALMRACAHGFALKSSRDRGGIAKINRVFFYSGEDPDIRT